MADFPEFILFALICAVMATLAVLGGVAFRRTSRLRDALALAEERIRYLEDALQELAVAGIAPVARPAPTESPAPAAASSRSVVTAADGSVGPCAQ